MSSQIFQVLTEFKFNATDAVANAKVLRSSINEISDAADNALGHLTSLSSGLVTALGVGGLLETLKKAVDISDNLQTSVLDFAGTIGGNMGYLQGSVGTFNDRLNATRSIMTDIAKTADSLDINKGDLLKLVKGVVPILAPQGGAGSNFKNAIQIAKSAATLGPGLGVTPDQFLQQFGTLAKGTSTGESGLPGALLGTNAIKGMGLSGLNNLDTASRLAKLSEGIKELSKDMGDAAERANLLAHVVSRIKEHVEDALAKLGDVLRPVLVGVLKQVDAYIKGPGQALAGTFAQLVKSFLKTPEKMIIGLMQGRQLGADLNRSMDAVKFVGAATGVGYILRFLTGSLFFINPVIGAIAGGLYVLGYVLKEAFGGPVTIMIAKVAALTATMVAVGAVLGKFGILLDVLGFIFIDVLAPLAGFLMIFQAISRAIAQAKVHDAEALAERLPAILELFTRMKMALANLFLPLTLAIDGLADLLEPLFRSSYYIDLLMPLFEGLNFLLESAGTAMVAMLAALNGLVAGVFQMILDIKSGNFSELGANFGKAVTTGFDDFMDKHLQKMDQGGNVSNQITNIGKVEIRNDFKESIEPDRVAFTLKEQLLKTAQNGTQSRGQVFQGGFAGGR